MRDNCFDFPVCLTVHQPYFWKVSILEDDMLPPPPPPHPPPTPPHPIPDPPEQSILKEAKISGSYLSGTCIHSLKVVSESEDSQAHKRNCGKKKKKYQYRWAYMIQIGQGTHPLWSFLYNISRCFIMIIWAHFIRSSRHEHVQGHNKPESATFGSIVYNWAKVYKHKNS